MKIKESYFNQKARFGKYKGKLISWIIDNDENYANWLSTKSNSNTKTKLATKSLLSMKAKIHIKDKLDFLKFYERIEDNVLKEYVMWKEQKDDEGNETGKVEIKIISIVHLLDVRDELSKIKD